MEAMVDRTSGVPAFRQVAADIRDKITQGEYAAGSRLPSERVLVDTYGVSRPTVRDAVNLLRTEGLLLAEHGRGVFIRSTPTIHRLARTRLARQARDRDAAAFHSDAVEHGFTPSSSVTIRFEPADARTAQQLALAEGADITVRDRIMSADGNVVQLATSRLPRTLTRGTVIEQTDTGPGGIYQRLHDEGHPIAGFAEHVGARMPTPDEISALQLPTGTPVVTVTRIAHTSDEHPVEMNDIVLPADRYELSYTWEAD